ncbi:uncharacterized protein LACBIDRAFT_303541 [Laccaria bicolor S238N-H82]|uniref:Predicted protein n=1 Tax=Laccaria bicolor (strain S238N-H82 / ATCC MYA-4686) TaxID=486041 RepID=B0DJN7_LACBS|nr:uncharacterized protein LACBIDRAFT_303541 [Laccaria bicolor S238N-H82]EDR05241.1 predicted protein [Laccaria bicolor S238N-H82]|eukprot:XP_001884206.1 predicted protein [Laccaria bicolor S238N-H82]
MPISVSKKASANVSALQHVKHGVHHRDIFGNEDDGLPLTSGIMTVTKHDSGGTTFKTPCLSHIIVTEGEISVEDAAKPGDISVLEPGDVIRVDKGTTITWSSPTSGKAFYVGQYQFGSDQKKNTV